MSDAAAYERRILAGIPFFVAKAAPKDARIPVYSWSAERIPFGHWSPDGGLELSCADGTTTRSFSSAGNELSGFSPDAVAALAAWRSAQVPRPRAQLRVGR